MTFRPPKIIWDTSGKCYIVFYLNQKRYRLSNGSRMGINLHPNRESIGKRTALAEELRLKIHLKLIDGWKDGIVERDDELVKVLDTFRINSNFIAGYRKAVLKTKDQFVQYVRRLGLGNMAISKVNVQHCQGYLDQFEEQAPTYNHERKHLSVILTSIMRPLGLEPPVNQTKKLKEKPSLHKPFNDVHAVLEDIRAFNENLFLCCLLTYGCLLRPHQEIRQLTWSDFSDDLKFISLSGRRNKSGRNRIVPVSPYIRQHLQPSGRTHNIFTGSEEPFNACYFKTLWSRYKKQSKLLEANQTLYSFRHTGAIEVYKKTKDIAVVQQVMGHASMQVTLGYLRNLEVPVLRVEDMPS